MIRAVVTAAALFAGTDIDDIVVLTVLFLSGRANGVPRPGQVWAGQYAGIVVLVAVSMLAAFGLSGVPDRWVGVLGLLPIALGVRGLVQARRGQDDDEPGAGVVRGVAGVAAVTVANGADNISAYTPAFATMGALQLMISVVVFAVGVAVWCLLAWWLSSHAPVLAIVERYGHWLVPAVFIAIGVVIIAESGAAAMVL